MNDVQMRDPEKLRPHDLNSSIYGGSDPDHIEELRESIEQHGILQPLLITEDGTVIAGCSRLEAALEAELSEVPVQVLDEMDENDLAVLLIHSNKQRVKTRQQIKNEILYLKKLWAPEAKEASEANLKQNATDSAKLRSRKKTSERIAEKIGESPRKVEQVIAIEKTIEELKEQGRTEEAEKIEALSIEKRGTNAAYQMAKEAAKRADVDDLRTLFDVPAPDGQNPKSDGSQVPDCMDVPSDSLSNMEKNDLAALHRVWARASQRVRESFGAYIGSRKGKAAAG